MVLAFVVLMSSIGFAWLDGFAYRSQVNVSSTSGFTAQSPYIPIILNDSNVNYSNIDSLSYALTYVNASGLEEQKVICETTAAGKYVYNESGNSYLFYNGNNGTYYVYYGNTSEVNASFFDCNDVFAAGYLYDEFAGAALNSTLFRNTADTASVSDGYLFIHEASATVSGVFSLKQFSNTTAMLIGYNSTTPTTNGVNTYVGFGGYDGYTAPISQLMWHDQDTKIRYGQSGAPTTAATTTWHINATQHDYTLRRNITAGFDVWKNGVIDGTSTATGGAIGAVNASFLAVSNANLSINYVIIGENVAGITYAFGAEETAGDSVSITTPTEDSINYGRSVNFTFIPDLQSESTANFSLYINGTLNNTFNATDETPYSTLLTLNHGEYVLRIQKATNASINSSVSFYVKEYVINATSDVVNPLITQPVDFYVYVSNYTNRATTTVYVNLDGTTYTASLDSSDGFNQTYYVSLTMPEDADDYNITSTLVLDFGAYQYNETNITEITVADFSITNCSSGIQAVLFNIRHEVNESYLTNATFKTIVSYYLGSSFFNYSYTFTNQDNATLCITPNYSTVYANIDVIISKDGYSQRTNYLVNATLTNSSQNITTYLPENTTTTLIDIEVNDEYNLNLVGAYIKVQRYYTSSTSWIDITTLKTDGLGETSVWLVPYTEAYRFLIYEGNTLVKTIDPIYITADSYIFDLIGSAGNDYSVFQGIAVDCSYNEDTKIMRCTATDPSGLMTSATLTVYENKLFGAEVLCTSTATGSAITPTCNLYDVSGFTDNATYIFSGIVDGNTYIFDTGLIGDIPSSSDFELTGVLATLLLFLTLVLLGSWNPAAAVVLGGVGLIVSQLMGILIISNTVLAIVLFLVILTVYKLRS